MLKKIRITLATVFFIGVTLLFLDFTGTVHAYLGWMAKVQFIPALLAHNVVIVVALLLLTLIFGRVYCSVICPLGVMQDIFAKIGLKRKKNRYSYSPEKRFLRITAFVVFIASLVGGAGVITHLLAPYSAYGRIAASILSPVYRAGNNVLASIAERMDSYAFYETEVWTQTGVTVLIAVLTLIVIAVLAYRNGRTYCNTICPVGTFLGYVAKYSWLKPVIDTDKCKDCGKCAKNCKGACIDAKNHAIDYSRCVACMDCLENCSFGAIKYAHPGNNGNNGNDGSNGNDGKNVSDGTPKAAEGNANESVDASRRAFLVSSLMVGAAATVKAQKVKLDGGLAEIKDRAKVERQTPIVPVGAWSAKHFAHHCTGCQLCVSACPSHVLRPSTDFSRLMQPELSYENAYCRPECTKCSEVCPTGAIQPITREEKSSIQIGHAVWVRKNCIPLTDGETCGNCARHCPAGAIQMVDADKLADLTPEEKEAIAKTRGRRPRKKQVPVINVERCIGCGACEALCPARPFTAIYVEGHERHKTI